MDSLGSGQGLMVGSCGYGNKLSGSIKGEQFLDYLIKYFHEKVS